MDWIDLTSIIFYPFQGCSNVAPQKNPHMSDWAAETGRLAQLGLEPCQASWV